MFKLITIALVAFTVDAAKLKAKTHVRVEEEVEPEQDLGRQFLAQMLKPSAKDIMDLFDKDGDGKISEIEFLETL